MKQQRGMTLSETVVSAAIIAIMIAVTIPAARILQESFNSSGAKSMISSALSTARALAAKHQRYAGIRFQYDPSGINQYLIFILHDQPNLSANGFRAVEGLKPMKLPEDQGVMDLYVADQLFSKGADSFVNTLLRDPNAFNDTTTFSIVFSPSGKLVIHEVRVLHFDNNDKIFNDLSTTNAMFQEDKRRSSPEPWREEFSRNSFIIYDKKKLSGIDESIKWTDYLKYLQVLYINPYTGMIIE